MKGNRPPDVCALCDRPIKMLILGNTSLHLYLGPGWVHGGGRENIPVHHGCLTFARIDDPNEKSPIWTEAFDYYRSNIGFFINGKKQ